MFDRWGFHLYVGAFGAGKTCTMVHDAYAMAQKFPYINILCNFNLYNFPAGVIILPLNTIDDVLNAPDDTLILIDEIGTIFNSRDFVGKKGLPKVLFQVLCQCRKKHIQILGTTQRWNFLDKQLRDIAATVTVSRTMFKHPFSRMVSCVVYDAVDYDLAFSNPVYTPAVIGTYVYVQTDDLRNRYDTAELVETLLTADYIPDSESLANKGDCSRSINDISRSSSRSIRKNYVK